MSLYCVTFKILFSVEEAEQNKNLLGINKNTVINKTVVDEGPVNKSKSWNIAFFILTYIFHFNHKMYCGFTERKKNKKKDINLEDDDDNNDKSLQLSSSEAEEHGEGRHKTEEIIEQTDKNTCKLS